MRLCYLLLILVYFRLNNVYALSYYNIFSTTIERYINHALDSFDNETECVKQLKLYTADVKSGKAWALNMLDSSGKLQPGLLTANTLAIGSYDTCLSIEQNRNGSLIKGQYCRAAIKPSPTVNTCVYRKFAENNIKGFAQLSQIQTFIKMDWDICLPADCSPMELQKMWNLTEKREEFQFHINFDWCHSLEQQSIYTSLEIAAISIFGAIGVVVLASTLYDFFIFQKHKKPDQEYDLFMAFSFYTNGKRLFSLKNEKSTTITCLHGIRVISMAWIILGHRFVINASEMAINYLYLLEWITHESNMFIIGAFACVDSFFLISGLLIVYTIMNANKDGLKINLFVFYFHRILRFLPSLGAIILIYVGILTHIDSGPFWNYIDKAYKQTCIEQWWQTLLFVQNYVYPDHAWCVAQSWYLAVDTQLYLLSPLIFLPLLKWPKTTISFIFGLIVAVIGYNIYMVYRLNLKEKTIQTLLDYQQYVYVPTHLRAGPWLVGTILGHYMFKTMDKKVFIKKHYVLLLWTVSLTIMLVTMYGYMAILKYEINIWTPAIFNGLSRTLWGICVGWIIFACARGHGGLINKFLSCSIFRVLARLTFSMFITHGLILGLVVGRRRTPNYIDNAKEFHGVWGDFAFTIVLSIIWTLIFESPVMILENFLLKKELQKVQNNNIGSERSRL